MDKVFGEYLHKYKEPAPVEEAAEGQEEKPLEGMPQYYEAVPVQDILGKEGLEYVFIVFSAEYCPPCQKLNEPLKAFFEEYSKDGKTEIILINCDAREKEYSEHLKVMDWCHALPFNVDEEILAHLEDASNASAIPKVAVFNIMRGFEKPVCEDIKGPILKMEVTEAMAKVQKMILDGEEALNQEQQQTGRDSKILSAR